MFLCTKVGHEVRLVCNREGLCIEKWLLFWLNWLPVTSKAVAAASARD